MERTYPREIDLSPSEYDIIDRIRSRIGDPVVFKREYMSTAVSATSGKLIAGGMCYYEPVSYFWPYNISVNNITYSGITISGLNPSVTGYQYLEFSTVSGGGSLAGKELDFGLETFKLSDKIIWQTYQNVDLTGLVTNSACITPQMNFLKACLDLCKILRTRRIGVDYSRVTVVDADTQYTKESNNPSDPYKDLYLNIESELDKLIYRCNKTLYWGGTRIE